MGDGEYHPTVLKKMVFKLSGEYRSFGSDETLKKCSRMCEVELYFMKEMRSAFIYKKEKKRNG